MPDTAKAPHIAVAVSGGLCVLALLFYAIAIAALSDLAGSDAAGNAYAQAYAAIALIMLWVLLAIVALIAFIKGAAPWPAMVAALILIPASGVVSMLALELLSQPYDAPYRWPIVIPAAVPLLIVAFSFWAMLPGWRAALPANAATAIAWGGTLALCLLIVPLGQMRSTVRDEEAAAREKYDADLAKLPADAPLWEWTPFLNTRNDSKAADVRTQISKLPRRQSEAELMLDRGDFPLRWLGAFDLDPTPALCDKARALLRKKVAPLVLAQPNSKPYATIRYEVTDAVAAMSWLVGYDCACDAEASAWETMANGYKDTEFDVVRLRELRDPKELGNIVRRRPERFSMLTPKAHLKAWLRFAGEKEFHDQALEGARKLDHRTADAVEMLHDKIDISAPWIALRYLPVLELEPNEALCGAALFEIRAEMAKVYRPRPDDPRSYDELLSRLGNDAAQLPALKWLASHGCDAEAALSEAETLVGSYKESFARDAMLASLTRLHRAR